MTASRLPTLDIGRGLAVFLMMMVHTLWMYGDHHTQTASLLGQVVHFIGKGSAAFLMCMGVSLVLSRRQGLASAIRRGAQLLLVGYTMNTLKFIVPIALGAMPESFIAAYGWHSPLQTDQLRWLLLTGDILQLAGVSTIFVAVVRHYLVNRYLMLVIALAIAALSRELSGLRFDIPGLYYISELLFGGTYHVYFPVFPWLAFIFIGLFLGLSFTQTQYSPRQVFSNAPYLGLPLVVIGGGLCLAWPRYHFGNFFHLGPGGVLYLAGINLMLMWAINALLGEGQNNVLTRFFSALSQRVTSLYVLHWTLICWGMAIVGYKSLNPWQTAAMMPLIIALSLSLHWGFEWLVRLLKKSDATPATSVSEG